MNKSALQKSNCENIVRALWKNAQIRVEYASDGLIVEIVEPQLKPENTLKNQRTVIEHMIDFNTKQTDARARFRIHRIFTYENEQERYKVRALLHTQRGEYSEDGTYVSYRQSGDAKVWMTEFDAATLIFDKSRSYSFTVLYDLNPTDPFAIQSTEEYQEITFAGNARAIQNFQQGADQQHWIVELA